VKFNKHSGLEGAHATLSPSTYHWIRYDDDALLEKVRKLGAARRGSQFHELANHLIRMKTRLPATKKTLNLFVNDVLGFRMNSEQLLFYSGNCFGTADAIGFKKFPKDDMFTLQVFDLKMGENPAKVDQLLVYAALFCLEYGFKAFEIKYDLRIYQNDEIALYEVDPVDVANIMAKIIHFDTMIEEYNADNDI
jgi:hypothetical protein